MCILIPSLLIGMQRSIETSIEKKNPNEVVNTHPPQESSVYYENTTGYANGIYVSGDYAYVADHSSGLAVIDISDPTNPGTPFYTPPFVYTVMDVYVSGDYAYLARGSLGFMVVNISDPINPKWIFKEVTNGIAHDVFVNGDYAYVADDTSGLAIIDISDPTNPGTPVYENTTGKACGVYVDGDYAYVADDTSGLAIINISDPTNPGTPVYEDTIGRSIDVYVSGDYAYIADDVSGLAIIDISDPTNPRTPVYEDTTGNAVGVYVSGDYAYVADDTSGLAIIDISDPTNPGTPDYENTDGYALDVYVSEDYAYVANHDEGLAVIAISEPVSSGTPIYENTTGFAKDVYVSGNYAYVANYDGLAVINISDPTNPGTPVYKNTTGSALGVYVSGNYAYIADFEEGLAIIDISDPTNPGTPVYKNTTGKARGVYVDGDYAYVADDTSGLAIIDISDPTNPGTPVYETAIGYTFEVYVSGDYAYVAAGITGLAIVNISDPTNPGPSVKKTTGAAFDVCVSGDYAYIADWDSGFAVIDISDPTNPGAPVYEITTGNTHGVCVSGDYAYVGVDGGLEVINISDPTNPKTLFYKGMASTISGVYVSGDYVYCAAGSSGLGIVQVRMRMEDPKISNAPSDFTVEVGYTGQSLSWTATDANPNNYSIELQGTGIVVPSTPWVNNTPIVYNILDGFSLGSYIFTINFTDKYGNSINDSVIFTVNILPIITLSTTNHTVEAGYIGAFLWWTATDDNPDTYTVELLETGLVADPTTWTSGNAINYSIPTGLGAGSYIYRVNFTDISGNFATDDINFTVIDTSNPFITVYANDITTEEGYSGQSFSWTVLDFTPNTYTIELQGTGIVAGPTAWTSGIAITYNIPDGFGIGSYIYTINITDDSGNFVTDSVNFTVEDVTNPIITDAPSSLIIEFEYMGQSLSWTATDLNPNTYTIDLQGTGTIIGPTAWTSGVAITYYIPDGFGLGVNTYTVNFTDDYGNSITDSVTFTVEDTTVPLISIAQGDITLDAGYMGESLSWTATDAFPAYYDIDLQGSGMQAEGFAWSSGVAITYNIPDGLPAGVYVYTVTFTDENNNIISDTVTVTINSSGSPAPPVGGVPFGNFYLLFIGLSIVCLIFAKKRQMVRASRK